MPPEDIYHLTKVLKEQEEKEMADFLEYVYDKVREQDKFIDYMIKRQDQIIYYLRAKFPGDAKD